MTALIRHRAVWWVLPLCAAPTGAVIALAGLVLAAGLGLFRSSLNLASGLGVFAVIVAATVGAVGALLIAAGTRIVRVAVTSARGVRTARPAMALGVAAVTTLALVWAVGPAAPTLIVSWFVMAIPGSLAGLAAMLALSTRELRRPDVRMGGR